MKNTKRLIRAARKLYPHSKDLQHKWVRVRAERPEMQMKPLYVARARFMNRVVV